MGFVICGDSIDTFLELQLHVSKLNKWSLPSLSMVESGSAAMVHSSPWGRKPTSVSLKKRG